MSTSTSTYTVTLTAAQGGRHPHAFRGIEADDVYDAVMAAYRERYGVTPNRRDIQARGSNVGAYSVIGTAGAITFADVEVVAASAPVEAAPIEDTVSTGKVWRCSGRDGSMYAKRDAFGFVEVFARNLDNERAAGTHLFKITL